MSLTNRLGVWLERKLVEAGERAAAEERVRTLEIPQPAQAAHPFADAITEVNKLSDRLSRIEAARQPDGRDRLRSAGYTEEGIGEVERMMKSQGIADYQTAADLYERANPPPEMVASTSSRWGIQSRDLPFDTLMQDPFGDSFLDQAIPTVLREVRGR
jgi:hypothetical protein